LVLGESLDYNKSRNVCAAGDKCVHQPRCINPGKQYQQHYTIYVFENDQLIEKNL
jgi:hypothetical protein